VLVVGAVRKDRAQVGAVAEVGGEVSGVGGVVKVVVGKRGHSTAAADGVVGEQSKRRGNGTMANL
jgi:hypothetical protein